MLETEDEQNIVNTSSIFLMNKDEYDAQYTHNTVNTNNDDMPLKMENEDRDVSDALLDLGIQLDAPRNKPLKLDIMLQNRVVVLDTSEPTSAILSDLYEKEIYDEMGPQDEEPPMPSRLMPRPSLTPAKEE